MKAKADDMTSNTHMYNKAFFSITNARMYTVQYTRLYSILFSLLEAEIYTVALPKGPVTFMRHTESLLQLSKTKSKIFF